MKVEIGYQSYVIPCLNCAYWDQESGLTARKCNKHNFLQNSMIFAHTQKVLMKIMKGERKQNVQNSIYDIWRRMCYLC